MKIRVFSLPALHPESTTGELNSFLASQRIVNVDRQFVADGAASFWSFCVTYLDAGGGRPESGKGEKVDYREVLPDAQFAVFAKLRTLRKEIAEKDGVPAYALFTNEQLADMVREAVTTLAGMRKLKGVGAARVEKYGAAFLEILTPKRDAAKPAEPAKDLFPGV